MYKALSIGQLMYHNDLRNCRRSLAWHRRRASRFKSFALVSARKAPAGQNRSGFGFQTVSFARSVAVRKLPSSRAECLPMPHLRLPDYRYRGNRYAMHASAADGLVLGSLSLRLGQRGIYVVQLSRHVSKRREIHTFWHR